MSVEAKIENPIKIKFGENENIIMADDFYPENSPLVPGARIGGNHYGFVLITDYNGVQKEELYPTQCKIGAVCQSGADLNVFERGKKKPWIFKKSGKLVQSIFDDNFKPEEVCEADTIVANANVLMRAPQLIHPVHIKLSKIPEKSVILRDERIHRDYPLSPGLILGEEIYGFILVIENEDGKIEKEIEYPTQNIIHGISCDSKYGNFNDLKIFEEGKYHPWVFTPTGEFKEAASYNEFSRRDLEYIKRVISSEMPEDQDRLALNMRKK